MARIICKAESQKRWKEQMKIFMSYQMRNEDALYIHNHTNQYQVCENKEFLQQLQDWKDKGLNLVLHKGNIRPFDYKKKKWVMLTINGDDLAGSDGDTISEMAFACKFLVAGFTYLFKYHSYKEIEKEIKSSLTYIKKKKEPIIEKPVCADCKKGISFCRTIDEKDYCLKCAVKYEKPL